MPCSPWARADVLGRIPLVLTAATLCGLAPRAAPAQTEVTLEVGASQIGPPVGLDAESARFGVLGIRASSYGLGGSGASLALLGGRTLGGSTGGDFLTLSAGGELATSWTPAWGASLEARMIAFGVRAPYPYRAIGIEGGPTLELSAGPVDLDLALVGGLGRSSLELWRVPGGRTRVFTDDLWRVGTTAELVLGRGPVRVGAAAGVHDTPNGTFSSGGGRVLLSADWGAAEIRADVWRTPQGTESTAGIALMIPMSAWSLRAYFGRSEPDPLTLAEPGSTGGGILVGHNFLHREAGSRDGSSPYVIVASTERGARVRVSIRAAPDVTSAALLGDFSLWEPLPMERAGDEWIIEVEMEPGTHHYGFLVDGEWYLPSDVRDVVPDEWGRTSAILVVEGER